MSGSNHAAVTTASLQQMDRPTTPGLGIPMEMTPGQIMEAEISATLLDNPTSPFHNPLSVGLSPPCSEEQVSGEKNWLLFNFIFMTPPS